MSPITIGRLAREAAVNIETIRYYERRGLLPAPPRSRSGYRHYGPDAVRRITFIRRAQRLGFTLEEIGELLGLRSDLRGDCEAVQASAERAVDRIAAKEAELARMRTALEGLILDCQERRASGECPILSSLEEPA